MRKLFWLVVLLGLLAAIVVASFPARLAVRLAMPDNSPVQLEDVSGSIWTGRAGRILYQGADQGALSWRVHPRALLQRQIDVTVGLEGSQLDGVARLVRQGEQIHVSDARFTLPATRLEPLLDIPALHLTGQVRVELDELRLQNRVPMALKGNAVWNDAGVTGADAATFGTLVASFGPLPGGGFGGEVSDQGGPLSLEGYFNTTLFGYEAEAILQARDGNAQVTRALRHIGQLQADGSVVYSLKGGLGQ